MKKLFGIAALVVMLSVTGCGADTLTCKPKEIKYTFKNDKVDKMEMKTSFDSKEEAAAYAALLNAFGAEEGIKVSTKDKNVTITYTGKGLEEVKDYKKADVKAEMEKEGYTCK